MNYDTQFADMSIRIIGSHRIQNELISRFLGRMTGAECMVIDDPEKNMPRGCAGLNRVLVLWDYDGEDIDGLLKKICTKESNNEPVVFIALLNVSTVMHIEQQWLKQGLRGIFHKEDSLSTLLLGVRHICTGGLWYSRDFMPRMSLRDKAENENLSTTGLTPRQIEILKVLANGVSNKDISDKLCISINTVRTHLHGIFQIIKVSSRHQAAKWAVKNLSL